MIRDSPSLTLRPLTRMTFASAGSTGGALIVWTQYDPNVATRHIYSRRLDVTGLRPALVSGLSAESVSRFSWAGDPLAKSFDVLRGALIALRADRSIGRADCLAENLRDDVLR